MQSKGLSRDFSNTTAIPQQHHSSALRVVFKRQVLRNQYSCPGGLREGTLVLRAEGHTVVFWQDQLPSPTRLSTEEQRPAHDQDAQNWGGAWQLHSSVALLCVGTGLGGKELAN